MEVEWRPVSRDPRYAVSADGAVRGPTGRILRTDTLWGGYSRVTFGGGIKARVHQLVCEAFHGDRPSPAHVPNHLNGRKADNRPENLEWATPQQNREHASRMGLLKNKRVGLPVKKLDWDAVREIRRRAPAESNLALSREFGISNTMVGYIIQQRYWRERTAPVTP